LIKRLSGTPGELKYRLVPYETFGKYEDVMRRVPDISKAQRLLGFMPEVSLEDGLTRTIEWQTMVTRSRSQEVRLPAELEFAALAAPGAAAR